MQKLILTTLASLSIGLASGAALAQDSASVLSTIKAHLECATAKPSYNDALVALAEVSGGMFNDLRNPSNMKTFNRLGRRFSPKGLTENGVVLFRNGSQYSVGFATNVPDETVERAYGLQPGSLHATTPAEAGKYPPLKVAEMPGNKALVVFTTTSRDSLVFCEDKAVLSKFLGGAR